MTSTIKSEVHISMEKDEPLQKFEFDKDNYKKKLVECFKDRKRETYLAKRTRNYATIDNLSKTLSLEKKKEFSDFFQIQSGRFSIYYPDCLERI